MQWIVFAISIEPGRNSNTQHERSEREHGDDCAALAFMWHDEEIFGDQFPSGDERETCEDERRHNHNERRLGAVPGSVAPWFPEKDNDDRARNIKCSQKRSR